MNPITISPITDLSPHISCLSELLKDAIEDGASIGFVMPVTSDEITDYWLQVANSLSDNHLLFVALNSANNLIGAVQIDIPTKANGNHRAEIQKLMVHTKARGQGVAKALMQFIEGYAKKRELSLLVLDTRLGDTASHLYRKLGYIEAGQIPRFAKNNHGGFDATVYFYKQI